VDIIMERTAVDLVPNLVCGHRRNGRTVYDREAKRELVRRVLQPGVSLAGTALAHGINSNLLRRWVVLETGKASRAARREASLLPVAVREQPISTTAVAEGCIEVVLAGGTVRVRGRVELDTLRAVIGCVVEHT
jgi:transposase